MSKMRDTTDMVEERPRLSIPQPGSCGRSNKPLDKASKKPRVIEIDLVPSKQDVFTIDL